MENNAKTNNFLKAIKKYAEEQRNAMRNEVEQLKEQKIKEARQKGKYDSEKLISQRLEAKRNEETHKIAKALQEGQKELFLERTKMTDSVFEKAQSKLIEFTQSAEYTDKLFNSAKAIAQLFDNESCMLYVAENDLSNADKICALFNGNAQVCVDKSIKIGGIKGYCSKMQISVDETLDSKLEQQRQWFIENSGLSVL